MTAGPKKSEARAIVTWTSPAACAAMNRSATLARATAASREPTADRSHRGGTETILLVEDDPGVRVFAQRVLENHGYRFAPSAIRAWRSKPRRATRLASMPWLLTS
jgi:hypothetical protein